MGDPNLQQKSSPEPGWSGWVGMQSAPPRPGKKLVLQQRPGSGHSITAHPHIVFEGSWFSTAFTARGCAVLPRFVTRVYFCSSLSASDSERGDLPDSKLLDASPATLKFPAPNSLWAEEDNPPHQRGQTLKAKSKLHLSIE